jgi:hypothetical protein
VSTEKRIADRLQLQKHILPIVVTFPDGSVDCIGTGFISVANGKQVHLITAAHVIEEIRKIDDPYPKSHLSMPEDFRAAVYRFELKHAKPRALYFDGKTAHIANIEAAIEMPKADIALCSIRFDDASDTTFMSRLILDSNPPTIGERVIAIGYARMRTQTAKSTADWIERSFDASWACPKGEVTAVYPKVGPTGQKGPCFQVSVAFKGGMSGGPVFTWDERGPYVRGFVMKGEDRIDDSDDITPFALAGMIWPILLMPVDLPNPDGSLRRERCLLDLEKEGVIVDKGNAHLHIKIVRGENLQIASAVWE